MWVWRSRRYFRFPAVACPPRPKCGPAWEESGIEIIGWERPLKGPEGVMDPDSSLRIYVLEMHLSPLGAENSISRPRSTKMSHVARAGTILLELDLISMLTKSKWGNRGSGFWFPRVSFPAVIGAVFIHSLSFIYARMHFFPCLMPQRTCGCLQEYHTFKRIRWKYN